MATVYDLAAYRRTLEKRQKPRHPAGKEKPGEKRTS